MKRLIRQTDPKEARELAELSRRFAEDRLAAVDNSREFRRADFDAMGSLGLTAMTVPEHLGGTPCSALSISSVLFELARLDLGPAIYLSVHLMVAKLISQNVSGDSLKPIVEAMAAGKKLAAFCLTEASAGSDAAAIQCRAEKASDGYRLSGEKIYITSGTVADVYLVFARTGGTGADGISAFAIERGTPGLSIGPAENKMGCESAPIASVTLDQCFVPSGYLVGKENQGYKLALAGLAGGRTNIAAAACGIAFRSLELALKHLAERRQFGKALAEFQGLQFMAADMAILLEASLLLTRSAAEELDRDKPAKLASAAAKCFATDAAMKIATDAVQLFGGAGYLADYGVERLMRDAKMLQIVEGTNQVQRVIIARELLRD